MSRIVCEIWYTGIEEVRTVNSDPIKAVLEYIDENIDEYLSVGKLSEVVNYSAPQLFRLFMSNMDVTPMKYTLRRKLYYAAKELVSSDAKIITVAHSFGFESHDSFCRAFKRIYGVTPGMFRKNACYLNKFYRDNLYCISGDAVPYSLINQEKGVDSMSEQTGRAAEHHVEIVTVPETKLIGVERLVDDGGVWEAFYEAYDKVFRNAPNRRYPRSENATHGVPRVSPDNRLLYFAGIEVTSLDHVPDGAVDRKSTRLNSSH